MLPWAIMPGCILLAIVACGNNSMVAPTNAGNVDTRKRFILILPPLKPDYRTHLLTIAFAIERKTLAATRRGGTGLANWRCLVLGDHPRLRRRFRPLLARAA